MKWKIIKLTRFRVAIISSFCFVSSRSRSSMISLNVLSRFSNSAIILSFCWISSRSSWTSLFSSGKGGGTMLLGSSPLSIRCKKSTRRGSSRSLIAFLGRSLRSIFVHFSRRTSNSSNSSVSAKISKRDVRLPLWIFVTRERWVLVKRWVVLLISPLKAGWPLTRPKGCSSVRSS